MSFFNGDITTNEFIIGQKSTTNAKIQMFDTNSTNSIIIQTPDDIITNYSLTLPNTVGILGETLVLENNSGSLIFSSLPNASRVVLTVKNDTLTTIPSGTPVYITGITAGNSGKLTVDVADSSDPSKMPAAGIIEGELLAGAQGYMVEQGEAFGLPTEGMYTTPVINDTLFVAPGGGLTDIKPIYPNLIQNIGRMGRVHVDNGFIIVTGPSRTNDVPNLGASNIWIGKPGFNTQEASIGGDLSLAELGATNEGIFTVNGISNTSTITSTANITMDTNKILYFRDTTSNIYSDAISNLSLEASNINISGDLLTIQSNIIVSDGTLTIASGETAITTDTVICAINFQAPLEASGSDASLICASIEAVADAEFTSTANSTKILFKTAKSELAPERMKLENNGRLTLTATTTSGSGIGPTGLRLAYTGDSNTWNIFRWDINLAFVYDTIKAFINPNNAVGEIDFTGQHRTIVNTNIDNLSNGLIVSSTGQYINLANELLPSINESLPVCEISNIDNDKRVFGVLSDKEDTDTSRNYSTGSFVSVYQKYNKNEQRMYINSVGEGGIWVCNKNGNIENGDYITSSTILGYGIKQNDDILHNYTVAKSTCDCTFSLIKIPRQKLKLIITTDEDGNIINNIDYDPAGNVQYENDLDIDNNPIMDYPLDTRFLDTDGTTQLTETEYTNKLNNGEIVYIACFIGCTYHCG